MRILAVADEEDPYLWNLSRAEHPDVDLILSCGDLEPEYLEYLVTVFNCPLLYVHGNHDDIYAERPPRGCICVEERIYTAEGINILGLGGSYRYREGSFMYTEKEMSRRARRARRTIWLHKGFDILLTHAPAFGTGDLNDLPHRGFRTFGELIERYRPEYHIYGHVHRSYAGGNAVRVHSYACGTKAVNASGKYWIDL